jgi:hypothetical protein
LSLSRMPIGGFPICKKSSCQLVGVLWVGTLKRTSSRIQRAESGIQKNDPGLNLLELCDEPIELLNDGRHRVGLREVDAGFLKLGHRVVIAT